jgi:hypothetical protein
MAHHRPSSTDDIRKRQNRITECIKGLPGFGRAFLDENYSVGESAERV